MTIHGEVAPGFEAVRDVFSTNIDAREVGAGVAAYVGGRKVVDLVGGSFDAARTQPYDPSTLQLVFSTTKGVAAICMAICVDRGQLDYDAPVTKYWPEFGAAGKQDVTVAQLISHSAGLAYVESPITLDECLAWEPVSAALAAQKPLWEPGTAHGYHALSYGWLAGELVRRVDGRTIGRFVAEELAGPLGLDLWIGLPESEEPRVSPVIPSPPPAPELAAMLEMMMGPETMGGKALSMNGAFSELSDSQNVEFNTRKVHAAEVPAANGITNAASLARLYSACLGDIDGVARLVTPSTLDRARTTVTSGGDKCLLVETTFGMGFMTYGAFTPMAGPGSFGHAGAGGSLAFACPESGLSFAYVMNQMDLNLAGDTRASALVEAVKACL